MTPLNIDRQIWIRLAKYSSAEVSDPFEVPRILTGQGSQAGLCALHNIVLERTSNSLLRSIVFLILFKNL